ncbi:disease resistance protein [Fagus crenata]
MEVVAAVVGALVTETGKLLCGCACSKISTAVNLPSNLAVLVKEMDNLMGRRKEVKEVEEVAGEEGNKMRAQVIKWLKDVENLQL